jgi:pyruvate formate lyase activating enzyme
MIFGGLTPTTLIDFPGKVAAIVYTIGCNFRCPYCHNPELVDETVEEKLSETYILDFLKRRKKLLDGLVITGGEPTMHGEDLLSFIVKVKKLGMAVKLDTNGTNPEFLEKVFEEKLVDYVAMDIKAPLNSYNKVVGRAVNTEKIKTSIELIKKSGTPYEFRTTIIKCLTSKDDVIHIAKDIVGGEKYYLQKFVPTKILNPQLKRKVTYTDKEFEELKKLVEPYVRFCGIR